MTIRGRISAWPAILIAIAMLPMAAAAQATLDWEAAGLQDAGTYLSPQYGFALAWDEAWVPNTELGEHAIVSDPVAGDYVSLQTNSPDARAEIYGNTWLFWGYGDEPDPLAAMLDAFATAPIGTDAGTFEILHREIDGNHAALAIVTDTGDGTMRLVYREFWNLDGRAFVYDSLAAAPNDFGAAWEAAGSITLDGELAFAALSDAELADIVIAADLIDRRS